MRKPLPAGWWKKMMDERKQRVQEVQKWFHFPNPPEPLDPYIMDDKPEDEASWWELLKWKFGAGENPEVIKNRNKNARIERAVEQKKNEIKLWKKVVDAEVKRAVLTNVVRQKIEEAIEDYVIHMDEPRADLGFKYDLEDAIDFHGSFYRGWSIPISGGLPPDV